ncbi:unnamed protein product [Cuscuta epithymum]|uniref:NERD domain-containing protein n=1 Tax=Cuscuta epithymum TaxID=186058 RepID=A0AAV0EGP3_9ASTE|nr:unnamed protein product [Cuscuta epithymum]
MWVELICGIAVFRLLKRFFSGDDVIDAETCHANALFSVARQLERLYCGKVFVGLQIPDADSGSRRSIDLVLVTQREVAVISVKNVSGVVNIDKDGSWVCTDGLTHKREHYPDPVAETKQLIPILESYLEKRGVFFPEGYLSWKVICPNPNFRTVHPDSFPSEVITYDQLVQPKPDDRSLLSRWIKCVFPFGKKEMLEAMLEKLNGILCTAPMWDRLELKNNKCLLGEFLEFKGKRDDILALRNVKRSKVSRLTIQNTSTYGLAPSKIQILYSPRDNHGEGTSASEWKRVCVLSSTEVLFQCQGCSEVKSYRLSSVIYMSLSV